MDRADFTEWLKRMNADLHKRMTTTSEGYLVIQHDPATGQTSIGLDQRAPQFSRWPKELTVTYSLN